MSKHILYRFVRYYVAAYGVMITMAGISWLAWPENLSSGYQIQLELSDILYYSWLIVFGVLLVIPHRWFMQRWLFVTKLAIITIGSLWPAYLGLEGISAYFEGGKSLGIIPVSLAGMLLIVAAPLSLFLKKEQIAATKLNAVV